MAMRVAVLWLLVASPAWAVDDPRGDDDPKLARATPPASDDNHDDPKLAREAAPPPPRARREHPVPRVKLAFRQLVAAGLEGGNLTFNGVSLDYYPSSGIFRFGIDTEVGLGDRYDAWYLTTGAVVGLQYPARVTPFVDGRFVAGLIGGSALGQTVVSYMYTGGIDSGIELYIAGRFYLTAAIGWAHPVYSGIDIAYTRANPKLAPHRKEFADDSFTFKIGFGL
jgi:hypothetical protein